jgi:hypothetical protein
MIEGHATQPDDQFEPAIEFSFSKLTRIKPQKSGMDMVRV